MEEQTKKLKINKKELLRTVKFTLFSISAGVIQIVSSLLLKLLILEKFIPNDATIFYITELNKNTFIADTVGLALSILWNFTFNRKFTFKAANNVPIAMLLAFAFYIPFYHFQIWYIDTIEKCLVNIGDWAFVIALGTCMIINFILEYLWRKFVVFRGAVDTNEIAQKEQEKNCVQTDENKSAESAEEQTDESLPQKIYVDVVLKDAGKNLISVIKIVREITGLGLAEAKALAESAPVTIAEQKLKEEAIAIAESLEKAGAAVELK